MLDVAPTRPARVALSRDLTEFLVELSVALHRHSMYPGNHPSLGPAAAAVRARAEQLLVDRPSIAFGIARRQIIIDGVATDPNQPVLRRLAEQLRQHHLGAVSVLSGVQDGEIEEALQVLASEPRNGALGLDGLRRLAWPHLRLHPVRFDGLALVAEAPLHSQSSEEGTRAAELWIGLARAAIATDDADGPDAVPTEPAEVAYSIDRHPGTDAYDQAIVGYMLQIAQELKAAPGEGSSTLKQRTSALVASLRPETLRRLVEMGGDAAQRAAFVLDSAQGMAVDAVFEIAKAAAEAGGQTISHGLVRMLAKLAAYAQSGSDDARPLAESALREQVGLLQANWTLADPNPEAYTRVLQHMATTTSADDASADNGIAGEIEPTHLLQMSLESGAVGPVVARAVDRTVAAGQVSALLDMLNTPPEHAEPASQAILARLLEPATLAAILRDPVDTDTLDRLLPFMTREGFAVMLDALASSDSRGTRRKLLDRLANQAPNLGPAIAAHLQDERWYVQRNMLVLLERSGCVPDGFSVASWTRHADPRVRHEAIRLGLTMADERDAAVATALQDEDPRIVRLGLTTFVGDDVPPALVDRISSLATDPRQDDDVRSCAVTALGRLPRESALQSLLDLASPGRTWWGRLRLRPKTPVLVAALRALAGRWHADERAAAILAVARASADAELREAAGGSS